MFKGEIQSLDARVAQDTRTLLVRGLLPNQERKLLPGMFANVTVLAGEPADVDHRAAHGRHLQPLRRQRLRGEAGAGRSDGKAAPAAAAEPAAASRRSSPSAAS